MPILNFLDLPIGKNSPKEVECVVEIAKDTNVKYEYDEELHIFRLDRCLLSSMNYPCSYGFIPSTFADDGDALDMLIYNSTPLMTGTVVTCRVLGVLDMTDGGKKDYKVLGVPLFNPNNYSDVTEIDPMFLKVTRNFFQYYKELEGKSVQIGDWLDANIAKQIIIESHQAYFEQDHIRNA
jgi:inorganic pyrophosphatase